MGGTERSGGECVQRPAGEKPLLLDRPDSAFRTGPGGASVFLTALDASGKPGPRSFLFDAGPGELLFGVSPEDGGGKYALLAVAAVDSCLTRLGVDQLADEDENATRLASQWLEHLEKAGRGENAAGAPGSQFDPHAFLTDPAGRAAAHKLLFKRIVSLHEAREQAEMDRLKRKMDSGRRRLSGAIARLAANTSKGECADLLESSGDPLLNACRLVGESMRIRIVPPGPSECAGGAAPTLNEIARASRIRTREVALTGEWYRQDNGPILGYMREDGRPVALIPASPNAYVLHDPASGRKEKLNSETAAKLNDSGAVFFRPLGSGKIGLRALLSFGLQSVWKRDLVLIALMGLMGGILGMAIPLATGIVFDSVVPSGQKGELVQIALILLAAAVSSMLFQLTRALATLRMEGKMDGALQAVVWDRLVSLPVPFFRQFTAGELAMRAMGIGRIRAILSGTTVNTILSGLFSLTTFGLLVYYNAPLAGVALMLTALAVLVMAILGRLKVRWERMVLDASNRIAGLMLQLVGGITKFRVAGAENMAYAQWAGAFAEQRQMTLRRETVSNVLAVFNAAFPVLSTLILFHALAAHAPQMPPGRFIGFYSAFASFMLSMGALSDSVIGANMVIPLYQKALPILEALPEDGETKASTRPLSGAIEVSHVSFRYAEGAPLVLKDVSLEIREGEYVALVGASGCGKSTLLRILLGFEKPETGKVYYNGQDLDKADVRSVRRQLGVVLQNGQLMMGTILTNIIGVNPRLTIDDAWEAARMSGIDKDIQEMPMGMFTFVSEESGTISGGQKQRLMIARAIVNKPRILFFDEATSALDNKTQAIVNQSIDALQATRVVIAHRLSTIVHCDKIYVLDGGRIVESGTYRELMGREGVFFDLARRQLA